MTIPCSTDVVLIRHIGLDSDRFCIAERNANFAIFADFQIVFTFYVLLVFLSSSSSSAEVCVEHWHTDSQWGIWECMGV